MVLYVYDELFFVVFALVNHKDAAHGKVSSEDFEILSVLGTGGERALW